MRRDLAEAWMYQSDRPSPTIQVFAYLCKYRNNLDYETTPVH